MSHTRQLVTALAVLLIITAAALPLGTGGSLTAIVLALAMLKVHLIGSYFMEIRTAPALLQRLFTGYVVATPAALLMIDAVV